MHFHYHFGSQVYSYSTSFAFLLFIQKYKMLLALCKTLQRISMDKKDDILMYLNEHATLHIVLYLTFTIYRFINETLH